VAKWERAREGERNNLINRLEAKSSNYFNYFSCRDYSFRSVVLIKSNDDECPEVSDKKKSKRRGEKDISQAYFTIN
jgi:hypothetical protein